MSEWVDITDKYAARSSASPADFYNRAYGAVLKAATDQGIENPEVIARLGAAQSSLETGYGRSAPGNNFFGIKGAGQNQRTREVINGQEVTINDSFRAYNSLEDSANDYVKFLRENPRYAKVIAAKSPDEAIAYQGRSGYATDPNYGPSLASIHSKYSNRPAAMVQTALNAVIPAAQAADANKGWRDIEVPNSAPQPSSNAGWRDLEESKPKATLPDVTVPAAAPVQAKPAEPPKSAMRRIDDFVRGAADAITFGYADEIAAKLDQLTGLNTANTAKPSGTSSYEANLAAQRERDKQGGPERVAGQLSTVFLPTVGVVRAADTATRLGRAGAGAATGAVQGALYGSGSAEGDLTDRAQSAVTGAGAGLVLGGALGTVLPATVRQQGNALIKKAGSEGAAKMDAEIIRDINQVAQNTTQRGAPVGATQLNALENKYIGDVNTALKQVGKKTLEATGLKADDISTAVRDRRIIGDTELNALRATKPGEALADAIEKAQRARSLTAPVPAATNPLARISRAALDLAPIPQPVRYVGQRILGARQTREDIAQKLISDKQAAAAENVLSRLGPSSATTSLQGLQQMAQRAQAQAQAQAAAQAQARAAQAAQQQAANVAALGDTAAARKALGLRGTPLSNAYQTTLREAGVTNEQAIPLLRTLRGLPDNEIGKAAEQLLKSQPVSNEKAFYSIQSLLSDVINKGQPIQPGALSSGIRNPISYAEAVRTAGEAANLARSSAPNKELAQFATKVAGTKSPADKTKLLQDRLGKTTDPAEISYLTNFIEPLTRFGAK